MEIGLYLAGKKGFSALNAVIKSFGTELISFVSIARDPGVTNDWSDEIYSLCTRNMIRCYFREKTNHHLSAEYRFAIGWRWIIPNTEGLIVFHDSLLPRYRGFSPLVNMLINGEREIGVTAFYGSRSYDAGDIIYQKSAEITYPKKISDAIDDVIKIYTELLLKIIKEISNNQILMRTPQNERDATYSIWRDEMDYFIDWRQNSDQILRFIDAVGRPYLGAASYLNGEMVRIIEANSINDVFVEDREHSVGKVIFLDYGKPVVVCGKGLLELSDIRKDGMPIKDLRLRTRFE